MPRRFTVPAVLVFLTLFAMSPLKAEPRVTVIIDDLGWSLDKGLRTVRLPGPVVCAILPRTPRAAMIGELANEHGKDVLLHLPLAAKTPSDSSEAGVIDLDMTRLTLKRSFAASLATVPFAIGVNGHRGSLLTRHPGHMTWLMEEVASRDLLFVDSYTTHRSVALQMAHEAGIPATRRHVFLDNDPDPAAIEREFERLVGLARDRGSAVAIGHPYPQTLDFLERRLPVLAADGIRLVGIRELIGVAAAASGRSAARSGAPYHAPCVPPVSGTPVEPECPGTL